MDTSSPLRRWIGRPETAHHDSERCRALLRRLLRDVAAFARQQQQRHPASATPDATLWIRAIARVCDARLEQLEDNAVVSSPTRPEDVVAEAMVQDLLVSLASIRVAETEALVLDHVEDVESLRRLSITLQRDDAALRRAVRDGAGDDAQLAEVQRLVRDAFVQELAQERAQGLTDSLHHEASLQFAWETIHEQKQEIVRLRAANEARAEPPDSAEEPLHAIQQLQLQLSSHPDTRLRALEAQLSHLEVAMGHRDARVVPSRLFTSGVTLSSSRDDVDDESMRGSVLLPSHLTTPEPAVRECAQCRRHVRAAVECQSENKQLRAQAAADEDALIRAEQVQAHMKKEHTALTSALMAAKQKQEELRQMILEITDEKLRIQALGEAQQRKHKQQVETLQLQVKELEQCRERSDRVRLDSLACEEAINTELSRLKMCHETIERERDALAKRVEDLERQVHDAKAEATVETAKAVEALNALAACDTETRSTKQRLQQTLEQVARHETTIELFKQKEQQQLEAERSASRQIRHLQQQLEQEAAKAAKHSEVATKQSARMSELTRELSTRDERIREILKDTANQQAAQQTLTQQVQSRRAEQQRLEQLIAELDGRLNQSEETRSELQNTVDQALARVKTLETAAQTSTQELQQAYEECHRLELSLADARAETSNLQTKLLEKEQAAESEVHLKAQLDGVVTSSKEQIQCLTTEIAETKTTILMWMSKYHTAVHAKDKLEEQLRSLQEDLATSAMEQDSAMERLRQEYHTLAEDKERVLQELEGDHDCDEVLLTGVEVLDDSTRRGGSDHLNQSWTTQHSEVSADDHRDRVSAMITTQGFAASRGMRPDAVCSPAKTSGTRRASVVRSRDGHTSLRVMVNRRTVTFRPKPSSKRAARSGDYRDGNSPSIHGYEQIVCDCRAAKVLLLWSKIVQNMKARSARVRMMETFSQYRQVASRAARICSRFKMLTTKLLATSTSRTLLTIAATNVRRIVTETIASRRDVRQHRAMAAWARVLRKMTAKRSPLLIVVKSLLHELRHRRDPHEFLSRWEALAWRFRCLLLRRDLWRVSLQCICVQQKLAQQHSLKVQFETVSQENSQQVTQLERHVMPPEPPVASHQIATVSTDLQVAMQECVTLLRGCYTNQTTYINDHNTGNGQIGARIEPAVHDIVDTAEWVRFVNLDRLIQLLLEGSKQGGEWKEAMDRKLHEISVREGQLRRLETHCTELQRIVETYHQVRHRRDQTTLVGADDQGRWWLSPDLPVQGAGQSTCVDPRSRALEKERRRLNQGTIGMLERVIAQLQEARDARLQLHKRLDIKTRSLENAQRYCRSVCIENLLLRAFYRWRLHTVFHSAA